MKWFKFNPCKWGLHDYGIVRKGHTRIHVNYIWGTKYDCPATVHIERCSRCTCYRSYVRAAGLTQSYPLDEVLDKFQFGYIKETFTLEKGEKWDKWAKACNAQILTNHRDRMLISPA